MTKQCNNIMEHVEAKIGNSNQPPFYSTDPERVYFGASEDINNSYNNVLTYGEDIQDQKDV